MRFGPTVLNRNHEQLYPINRLGPSKNHYGITPRKDEDLFIFLQLVSIGNLIFLYKKLICELTTRLELTHMKTERSSKSFYGLKKHK